MTKEEAIKQFESELNWAELNTYPYVSKQKIEADKMAIKALEQKPCEDCISRQAVLEFIGKQIDHSLWAFEKLVNGIKDLPPVTPQPKTGHWRPIYQGDEIIDYRCSECKFGNTFGKSTHGMNYCPDCGAKMERE